MKWKNIAIPRGKCVNCGSNRNLEKHHIAPLSRGGNDVESNLCWLCRDCHLRKLHNYKYDLITLSKANMGRKPATELNDTTESAIKSYLTGTIGTRECKAILGVSNGSHLRESHAFIEYEKKYGRTARHCNSINLRCAKKRCYGLEYFFITLGALLTYDILKNLFRILIIAWNKAHEDETTFDDDGGDDGK